MKFIGIKELYYGEPLTEAPTPDSVASIIAAATKVTNSHQDTFTYEQDDPDQTEYVNELTGTDYYIDKTTNGQKRINFTMGEYEFQNRVDLAGGTYDAATGVYASPTSPASIEKCIIALSKTDMYIVWPKASIIGKTDTQEKALGLGVTATCIDPGVDGMSDEYLFAAS